MKVAKNGSSKAAETTPEPTDVQVENDVAAAKDSEEVNDLIDILRETESGATNNEKAPVIADDLLGKMDFEETKSDLMESKENTWLSEMESMTGGEGHKSFSETSMGDTSHDAGNNVMSTISFYLDAATKGGVDRVWDMTCGAGNDEVKATTIKAKASHTFATVFSELVDVLECGTKAPSKMNTFEEGKIDMYGSLSQGEDSKVDVAY